jgi:preprotein translocase subunit YajC
VWPFVITLGVLAVLMFYGQRRRRRQLAEEMVQISSIGFGDEVMTTSGLYGTVVGRNDDGTVQLAIAPGVVVKWALPALRTAASLSQQYRQGIPGHDEPEPGEPGAPPQAE